MTNAAKTRNQPKALPLGVVVNPVSKADSIIFWTGFSLVIIVSIAVLVGMAMEVFS